MEGSPGSTARNLEEEPTDHVGPSFVPSQRTRIGIPIVDDTTGVLPKILGDLEFDIREDPSASPVVITEDYGWKGDADKEGNLVDEHGNRWIAARVLR